MRKLLFSIFAVALVLNSAAIAAAAIIDFQPDPVDIYDLDHHYYYTWGIDWSIPSGESIVSATLFFDNIENWDSNANVLYGHLLDSAPAGVTEYYDNQMGGDDFDGQGTFLFQWDNLPNSPQDLYYYFSASDISALTGYLADGNVAFGFDPDCHYWNDGITLTIETAAVPEPANLLLLGSGLVCVGLYVRHRRLRG